MLTIGTQSGAPFDHPSPTVRSDINVSSGEVIGPLPLFDKSFPLASAQDPGPRHRKQRGYVANFEVDRWGNMKLRVKLRIYGFEPQPAAAEEPFFSCGATRRRPRTSALLISICAPCLSDRSLAGYLELSPRGRCGLVTLSGGAAPDPPFHAVVLRLQRKYR